MLVSIYLPTKDRKGLLSKALNSVLNQSYRDIEVIVVNDGSSDATRQYLLEMAARDARLVVINNEKPCGAPRARNIAIRTAKGEFVTGLDDDDEFTPGRIAAFVDFWWLLHQLEEQPSCLYSQDVWRRDGLVQFETKKKSRVTFEDMFEFNCIGNQIFAPRTHFIQAGLFNEELPAWQDLEFFLRLVKKFGPARLLDAPTYLFDHSQREDRISRKSENKIREACALVSSLHAANSPRHAQCLLLQIFSDFYGIRPRLDDWRRLLHYGLWPDGMRRMLRAMRNRPPVVAGP